MKLQLPINFVNSYNVTDKFLAEIPFNKNEFNVDQSLLDIPHAQLATKAHRFCYCVSTTRKNKKKKKKLFYWSVKLNLEKLKTLKKKMHNLDLVYIFTQDSNISKLKLPRKCFIFQPNVHLKTLNFSDFTVLIEDETLEMNVNNPMLNTIYSLGATPFYQVKLPSKKFQIHKQIPLSLQHTLNILRVNL